MSDELTRMEKDSMGLVLVSDPAKQIEQAEKACKALMEKVKQRELFIKIGKATHLKIEAWLLLGHFFGVTVQTTSVFAVTDELTGASGYEATAEAVHMQSGRVVGRAVARCLNNEDNWGMRPKYQWDNGTKKQVGEVATASYQIESMAQTRANSKALSSALRWVVVLGGGNVEGTPAEEMQSEQAKEQTQQQGGGAKKISDGQRKRIFAIAKEHNVPMNDLPEAWKRHGFGTAADITMEKYDGIVAEIQNWGQKATAAP